MTPKSRSVYVSIPVEGGNPIRLGACVSTDAESGRPYVAVWRSGGGSIGGYWLDRFPGGKLTVKTLADFMSGRES